MSFTSAAAAAKNADQIESEALRDGAAPLSSCLTDEMIAGEDLDELFDAATNPDDNADWAKQEAARETAEAEAASEIERRVKFLGTLYPFSLSADRNQLSYLPERSKTGMYEFCLAFPTTPHELKAKPCCYAVREFERVVGRLLAAHLGPGSVSFRFGWPPEPSRGDKRPTTLSAALADMRHRTHGDWEFTPSTGLDAQAEQGDGDIDVVVWKAFGDLDTRRGMPFLLAQCACGDDGLHATKWSSLQPRHFEDRFNGRFTLGNLPLRCFATPHHIPDPGRWREMASEAGIILDRVRLTWMAETRLADGERSELQTVLKEHTQNLNSPRAYAKRVKPPKRPAKPKRK